MHCYFLRLGTMYKTLFYIIASAHDLFDNPESESELEREMANTNDDSQSPGIRSPAFSG